MLLRRLLAVVLAANLSVLSELDSFAATSNSFQTVTNLSPLRTEALCEPSDWTGVLFKRPASGILSFVANASRRLRRAPLFARLAALLALSQSPAFAFRTVVDHAGHVSGILIDRATDTLGGIGRVLSSGPVWGPSGSAQALWKTFPESAHRTFGLIRMGDVIPYHVQTPALPLIRYALPDMHTVSRFDWLPSTILHSAWAPALAFIVIAVVGGIIRNKRLQRATPGSTQDLKTEITVEPTSNVESAVSQESLNAVPEPERSPTIPPAAPTTAQRRLAVPGPATVNPMGLMTPEQKRKFDALKIYLDALRPDEANYSRALKVIRAVLEGPDVRVPHGDLNHEEQAGVITQLPLFIFYPLTAKVIRQRAGLNDSYKPVLNALIDILHLSGSPKTQPAPFQIVAHEPKNRAQVLNDVAQKIARGETVRIVFATRSPDLRGPLAFVLTQKAVSASMRAHQIRIRWAATRVLTGFSALGFSRIAFIRQLNERLYKAFESETLFKTHRAALDSLGLSWETIQNLHSLPMDRVDFAAADLIIVANGAARNEVSQAYDDKIIDLVDPQHPSRSLDLASDESLPSAVRAYAVRPLLQALGIETSDSSDINSSGSSPRENALQALRLSIVNRLLGFSLSRRSMIHIPSLTIGALLLARAA